MKRKNIKRKQSLKDSNSWQLKFYNLRQEGVPLPSIEDRVCIFSSKLSDPKPKKLMSSAVIPKQSNRLIFFKNASQLACLELSKNTVIFEKEFDKDLSTDSRLFQTSISEKFVLASKKTGRVMILSQEKFEVEKEVKINFSKINGTSNHRSLLLVTKDESKHVICLSTETLEQKWSIPNICKNGLSCLKMDKNMIYCYTLKRRLKIFQKETLVQINDSRFDGGIIQNFYKRKSKMVKITHSGMVYFHREEPDVSVTAGGQDLPRDRLIDLKIQKVKKSRLMSQNILFILGEEGYISVVDINKEMDVSKIKFEEKILNFVRFQNKIIFVLETKICKFNWGLGKEVGVNQLVTGNRFLGKKDVLHDFEICRSSGRIYLSSCKNYVEYIDLSTYNHLGRVEMDPESIISEFEVDSKNEILYALDLTKWEIACKSVSPNTKIDPIEPIKLPPFKNLSKKTIQKKKNSTYHLRVSDDGSTIACVVESVYIALFSVTQPRKSKKLKIHKNDISAVQFSDCSNYLYTGGYDSQIKILNLSEIFNLGQKGPHQQTKEKTKNSPNRNELFPSFTLKGHEDAVTDLKKLTNANILISSSLDSTIKIWDLSSFYCIQTIEHDHSISHISTSSNNDIIISENTNGEVVFWNLFKCHKIKEFKNFHKPQGKVKFNFKSHSLYVCCKDGLVHQNLHSLDDFKDLDPICLHLLKKLLKDESKKNRHEKVLSKLYDYLKLNYSTEYLIYNFNLLKFLNFFQFENLITRFLNDFGYPYYIDKEDDPLYYSYLCSKCDLRYSQVYLNYFIQNPDKVRLDADLLSILLRHDQGSVLEQTFLSKCMFKFNYQKRGEIFNEALRMKPVQFITSTQLYDKEFKAFPKLMKEYECGYSNLPLELSNGSTESMLLFSYLYKCTDEVITSDLKYLINHKWAIIKPWCYLHSLLFMALTACSCAYLMFCQDSYWLFVSSMALNIYFMIFELQNLRGNFKQYIFMDLNWVDLFVTFNNVFILRSNTSVRAPNSTENYIRLFFVMLVCLRAITQLRIIDQVRYIISMILQSFLDIIPFLVVYLCFILTYSLAWIELSRNNESKEDDASFWQSMAISVNLALGAWETTGFSRDQWILFLIGSLTLTLIMLNFLVAIICDAYEHVKEDMEVMDLRVKLKFILDFDKFLNLFSWMRDQGGEAHFLMIKDAEKDEENELLR